MSARAVSKEVRYAPFKHWILPDCTTKNGVDGKSLERYARICRSWLRRISDKRSSGENCSKSLRGARRKQAAKSEASGIGGRSMVSNPFVAAIDVPTKEASP